MRGEPDRHGCLDRRLGFWGHQGEISDAADDGGKADHKNSAEHDDQHLKPTYGGWVFDPGLGGRNFGRRVLLGTASSGVGSLWSSVFLHGVWLLLGGGVQTRAIIQDQAGRKDLELSDTPHELTAGEDEAGERVDRFLAGKLPDLSRSRIQALIKAGAVRADGATISEAKERVKSGSVYQVAVPEPEAAVPAAERIALNVVFEDEDVVVVDKPAGLVVHPAPGHATGTLVNALIAHCGDSLSGIGGVRRPGIVHRLDKDTSGLLVVAKNDAAHKSLSKQFAEHGRDGRLHRAYRALVWGVPDRPIGTVDAALGRSSANRMKMAVVSENAGRFARTHYELEEFFQDARGLDAVSLMRVKLETGRTHQIRVHLAHIRHPVLGDQVYGTGFKASSRRLDPEVQQALAALGRQALHAAELGFEHPVSNEPLAFISPLPGDMTELISALRGGAA